MAILLRLWLFWADYGYFGYFERTETRNQKDRRGVRRPYRVECTGSLSTSGVKRYKARLVHLLLAPRIPRSLHIGPAIGSARHYRPTPRQHLRLYSARLAGAFPECSLGEGRLCETLAARLIGRLPDKRRQRTPCGESALLRRPQTLKLLSGIFELRRRRGSQSRRPMRQTLKGFGLWCCGGGGRGDGAAAVWMCGGACGAKRKPWGQNKCCTVLATAQTWRVEGSKLTAP
jgi:hypothetical protein